MVITWIGIWLFALTVVWWFTRGKGATSGPLEEGAYVDRD
jgi:hypothetical protein